MRGEIFNSGHSGSLTDIVALLSAPTGGLDSEKTIRLVGGSDLFTLEKPGELYNLRLTSTLVAADQNWSARIQWTDREADPLMQTVNIRFAALTTLEGAFQRINDNTKITAVQTILTWEGADRGSRQIIASLSVSGGAGARGPPTSSAIQDWPWRIRRLSFIRSRALKNRDLIIVVNNQDQGTGRHLTPDFYTTMTAKLNPVSWISAADNTPIVHKITAWGLSGSPPIVIANLTAARAVPGLQLEKLNRSPLNLVENNSLWQAIIPGNSGPARRLTLNTKVSGDANVIPLTLGLTVEFNQLTSLKVSITILPHINYVQGAALTGRL